MKKMNSNVYSIIIVYKIIFSFDGFHCLQNPSHLESNCLRLDFPNIEFGNVHLETIGSRQLGIVTCEVGYDLDGPSKLYCMNGRWEMSREMYTHPKLSTKCIKKCLEPPYLKNGRLNIEGDPPELSLYKKGTLVTYSCAEGFALLPPESKYRVCEKGIWTGPLAHCVNNATGCNRPKSIANGFIINEKSGSLLEYNFGERLQYSCRSGFNLFGSSVQQCMNDGTWSPKTQPTCFAQTADITSADDMNCDPLPNVPNSETTVIQGYQTRGGTVSITMEIRCVGKYRNMKAPCKSAILKCINGKWKGSLPTCVLAHECDSPPKINFGSISNVNFGRLETEHLPNKFPINSQITYNCLPGYVLEGNDLLTCTSSGCWSPKEPICTYSTGDNYYLEVNSINAILISSATGAGVLGFLLLICAVVICKRRKPMTRTVSIQPSVQRQDLGDHAALLHHPDRLALIAFADGLQGSQSSLPSYDEATRDRGPGLTVNRLHRPHWPNLGCRRARNSPNPDMVHVTRHGSFASHTPSTRSAGDSMGSTDTMAVSEGSTNITLDTASSYSGSQPASCRAHCGSLASFDTCSVVNTEDVPLLEESELEEIQIGNVAMDNSTISDTSSFKLAPSTNVP